MDVILRDCLFLTAFLGGLVCFLRSAFFARFVATVFDFDFFLAFFLLKGMAGSLPLRLVGGRIPGPEPEHSVRCHL